MVVLEAAAVGVPVLSLKINYDDLIDTYHGGIFCESDFIRMNENLKLLVSDENLNREMSKNAKQYVMENHDIVKNVKTLIDEILK